MQACQTTTPQQTPNVIYILMDDLGYGDIGCMGQQLIETPHIDALRKAGMLFTQHYSGSPVSAPSRCVLLTGLHSGHSQIGDNGEMAWRGAVSNYDSMFVHPALEGQYPLQAGTQTLGTLARKAGYTTALCGKWGLGYPGSEGTPNKQGFDYFYGYNCQRQCHTYYPAFLYENEERVYLNNKVMNPHTARLNPSDDPYDPHSFDFLTQNDYANDFIYEAVRGFVEQNAEKPFFLMWTTPLPHVSLMAPQKWVDYYVQKFGDETPYLGASGYAPCRYPHATYAAMISYFDQQVGDLVQLLKDKGIYDNTLIVFTSDNGPTFNGGTDSPWFNSAGPFKEEYGWGKCFVHEGGIRTPMIAVWPGHIEAGSTSDHICAFQDVMPTLAQLLQLPVPEGLDGISFLPSLLQQPNRQQTHEYLYFEYPSTSLSAQAVRIGPWKGILRGMTRDFSQMELFNLNEDIEELHNIAAQHPDIVTRMSEIMMEQERKAQTPSGALGTLTTLPQSE